MSSISHLKDPFQQGKDIRFYQGCNGLELSVFKGLFTVSVSSALQ